MERIANKLFIIKSFRYYHNGVSFAETKDTFLRLWNPLTWIIIVTAGVCYGIAQGFTEVVAGITESYKAKQEYLKAKENGWLID